MSTRLKHALLFMCVIIIAVALRLPGLAQRPMHTDEAVHAIKFADLLENGDYQYDPREYHGPTLNYFTLIPAWMSSASYIAEFNEVGLRIVPVSFGILLILLLLSINTGLGYPSVISAALLTAISPAMVYYSRYYIQEMLLVCFTLGAIATGYRYLKNRDIGWVMATGIFLGLMHVTKETCIIAWGSIGLALVCTAASNRRVSPLLSSTRSIPLKHILALIGAALLISVLFFSSFFKNMPGIIDSVTTYSNYFNRAGSSEIHDHPWYFYLHLLGFYKMGAGPVWSESFIIILAIAGAWSGFSKRKIFLFDKSLVRFFAFYTLFMLLIYSLIPYKTPWLLLGFLSGMTVLAGTGAATLFHLAKRKWRRILIAAIIAAGCIHLLWQSVAANFRYAADPVNPYVYAHTSSDIEIISKRIHEIAAAHPQQKEMFIEVICPGHDYWSLPWYFRDFQNVGWWDKVNFDVPAAPVIIAMPEVEPELIRKLYEMPAPGETDLYLPLFERTMYLRPGVELRIYVEKDLWDSWND